MLKAAATILLFLLAQNMFAQNCTTIGQNPTSAIIICGTGDYSESSVPLCGNTSIPTPCTDGAAHQNKNPFWFRFACYSAGTIGFLITPYDPNDDYNWQLFDITNHNPVDVFTDTSLFVACNWAIGSGVTGASVDGTSNIVCSGQGEPLFSAMPNLFLGHEYLLMVSHFTNSPSGFHLEFNDGSAGITDLTEPVLRTARVNCDGTKVLVTVNRAVKCSTLAANGSDFTITPSIPIISATTSICNSNNFFDSVILNLNSPLPGGNYILTMQNGTDGNTLLDLCNRPIAVGSSVQFVAAPLQPTPVDSVTTPVCKPAELQMVFQRPILCSSIAGNGSDFVVTGPQAVTVSGINTTCSSGTLTSTIKLLLASPIVNGGIYQVRLVSGSDGNTIIDECGSQTPAGSAKDFFIPDTVSASFSYSVRSGCKNDTVTFLNDGGNGVNSWTWKFDNNSTSSFQNPSMIYSASSSHIVQLTVTNGICSANASQNIVLNDQVTAAFESLETICPEDSALFINKTTGSVNSWLWNFGNGITSTAQNPGIIHYQPSGSETFYTIWLTATGSSGCKDSTNHRIKVLSNCFIAVPTAFTPNHDGLNDYLYPLNALKADNFEFKVFNRWGKVVFASNDWLHKWDGTVNGIPQATGIYVWILHFTHHDTGKKYEMKGTTLLIR